MNKQHIIDEIRRTAVENGGTPLGMDRFSSETGIGRRDWYGKYWARWGDAVIEAGYKPNTFATSFKDDWVIEKMISLIRELGRYPVAAEIEMKRKRDKDFPNQSVFWTRWKKATLAGRIIEYCRSRDGFDDVVKICEPLVIAGKDDLNDIDSSKEGQAEIGYVYLLKSGRYYKVGRTNDLGRREYDLAIQLPEKATRVHAIKTDDPVGIEAYWHGRFQDRRKNGEWFELTAEDVKAFKRRKFM